MNILMLALQAEGGRGGGLLPVVLMWGAIIAIFWFILIRPQRQAQQRHQAMVSGLKKGDHVMTDGGILGEIVHVRDDRVTIRTGEDTRVVVARPKIARVLNGEAEPNRS